MTVRSGRRMPGFVNIAGAAVLLALVLTIALRAAANTTPAVAEFAPQAQQIKQAPQEQTSVVGSAAGGAGGGAAIASPSPAPTPPPNAVLFHCVGDPPRQIEDPQSPPCVPYWSGDNGGVTHKGVTSVQVRIDTHTLDTVTYGYQPDTYIENFLNQRFELYGRKIFTTDDSANPGGPIGSATETTELQDAQFADSQNVFAATTYPGGNGFYFYQELARRGILSATYFPVFTEPFMKAGAPYFWQYPRAVDEEFSDLGTWLCREVVGHNAVHAGDAALQSQKRIFGVYLDQETNLSLSTEPMRTQLRGCGSDVAYEFVTSSNTSTQDVGADYANAGIQMQQKHVTSVICLCLAYTNGAELASTFSGQHFHPEWILSSYFGAEDFYEGAWPRDQYGDVFGMGFLPKHHPIASDPAGWAYEEGGGGTPVNDLNDAYVVEGTYRALLLVAAGIQMAGPDLTPQSFAAGLNRAIFPNPPTPLRMGAVGFNGGEHGMTRDDNEWWWGVHDVGPYSNQGEPDVVICYIDRGRRIQPGRFPTNTPVDGSASDPYFKEPCDSGRTDTP